MDVFRGIVILDMILIHFNTYFPATARKLLDYFDFAMDGFVFTAGLMIGAHYLDQFRAHPYSIAQRVWLRAAKLYSCYLLIVFTVIAPYYYFLLDYHDKAFLGIIEELILLKRQVGIAHILPTFIPLFLVAPLVLWLIVNGRVFWVVIPSFMLFVFGLRWPYLFSYTDNTIFPAILWQVYFCIGVVLGISGFAKIERMAKSPTCAVLVTSAFLLLAFFKFGTSHIPLLERLRTEFGLLRFQRFPLNVWGFMFGISLVLLVLLVVYRFFNVINASTAIRNLLERFGRHSLLVFVLHVYFVYTAMVIAKLTESALWPNAIFGACLLFLALITRKLEGRNPPKS